MKTQKNILIAFLLNISFSILEFIGGIFTNSVAITSDAIHDLGDATSIGISFFLEKKSNKNPDAKFTYGYKRYSILGAFITSSILLVGSIIVIYSSIKRIYSPVEIKYNGMIILSIFGVVINFLAAYFTHEGDSLNQKAVNLHMLEDVLGWIIVLVGSILMKFTNINLIDSIMSFGVACFILYNVIFNIKEVLDLFLEKTPKDIDLEHIKEHLLEVDGVIDVHHIHIWSLDNENNYATLHVVIDKKDFDIKDMVKEEMKEFGINHTTVELELQKDNCSEKECEVKKDSKSHHHHHN